MIEGVGILNGKLITTAELSPKTTDIREIFAPAGEFVVGQEFSFMDHHVRILGVDGIKYTAQFKPLEGPCLWRQAVALQHVRRLRFADACFGARL